MAGVAPHYAAVVIGSGFGGSMTALPLAREFKRRGKHETLLMLERGTWWTTPVETVQDKQVKTYAFLRSKNEPVQFWSSIEHFRGFIDIVLRCVRRRKNEDGLYDLTAFGRRGWLVLGGQNDGVTILRACGVGGGSLIYANVTIQPPDFVFADPRWPTSWDASTRNRYFELARDAIGYGVIHALDKDRGVAPPAGALNTGLSSIVTRSARLDPHWRLKPDPNSRRGIKQIDLGREHGGTEHADPENALWIDRARVFQTAMSRITQDYGTVDSSINDIAPEPSPFDPGAHPANYCERQGRCIIGCLPGARHTLNKQLMRAVHGTPRKPEPEFPDMKLQALAEVDSIWARGDGGYEVHYVRRDAERPWRATPEMVTADRVIIAAGCVGTSEIMLRSKRRGGLPNLSDKLGFGFSTNGDYLAFLEGTKARVSLTRGPVTTSFGHFHTPDAGPGADPSRFHTIEDQGIPRAFSTLTGFGVPLLRSLAKGRRPRLLLIWAAVLWMLNRCVRVARAYFLNARERQDVFQSEDEYTARMMCIAAMGREAAVGQFRLGGGRRETPLRVRRADGKEFYQDAIYGEIRNTLTRFAKELKEGEPGTFLSPFLTPAADALGARSIALTHPLGGCRMAKTVADGVVDEYGRVFDKTKAEPEPFYKGLYLADAAVIPTALGVNPSLTISALALRIGDKIIEELGR